MCFSCSKYACYHYKCVIKLLKEALIKKGPKMVKNRPFLDPPKKGLFWSFSRLLMVDTKKKQRLSYGPKIFLFLSKIAIFRVPCPPLSPRPPAPDPLFSCFFMFFVISVSQLINAMNEAKCIIIVLFECIDYVH